MGEPAYSNGSSSVIEAVPEYPRERRPALRRLRVDQAATDAARPLTAIRTSQDADHVQQIENAISALRNGDAVMVATDSGEVALMAPASCADVALVSFMVRHTSGFLCVALPEEDCERLALPPMQAADRGGHGELRVTVDAAAGIGTGISARDRAHTAALLADPTSVPSDFTRPGHVVPVAACTGGILERPGDAEIGVELAVLAGLAPAALMARLVSPVSPERMANTREAIDFGADRNMPMIHVDALRAVGASHRPLVVRIADTRLPMPEGTARAVGYRGVDGSDYLVLVSGAVSGQHAVPTWVHRECVLGDVFGSDHCGCGGRLDAARRGILASGGVLICVRGGVKSTGFKCSPFTVLSGNVDDGWSAAGAACRHILRDLGVLGEVMLRPTTSSLDRSQRRDASAAPPTSRSDLWGGR
jgi:3,4-dihydroxy 2-butanone 4-phosphate synthase/GTP cyclohydrolase II